MHRKYTISLKSRAILGSACLLLTVSTSCARLESHRPTVVPVQGERTLGARSSGDEPSQPTASVLSTPSPTTPVTVTEPVRAQTAPTVVAVVDPDVVAETDPLPPAPEDHPPTDDATNARLNTLRRIVARTDECWTYNGERLSHVADRRCPQWFASLLQAQDIGVRAIGERLIPSDEELSGEPISVERARERRMSFLRTSRSPIAAQFLLSRVHYIATHASDELRRYMLRGERETMETFEVITGYPVVTVASWDNNDRPELEAVNRAGLIRALRWWHRVGSNPAAWQQESDTRLRAWLSSARAWSVIHASDIIEARPNESTALRPVAIEALERVIARADCTANERSNAQAALTMLRRSGASSDARTPRRAARE